MSSVEKLIECYQENGGMSVSGLVELIVAVAKKIELQAEVEIDDIRADDWELTKRLMAENKKLKEEVAKLKQALKIFVCDDGSAVDL